MGNKSSEAVVYGNLALSQIIAKDLNHLWTVSLWMKAY
jgi:hypothetical protein